MTIPDSSGYEYMMENGSIELPCKPKEERRIVRELTAEPESNLREGNLYFIVSSRNHYGGLGGGRYSAYCKLIDENRWYHFDDAHVLPVNESEIKTSAAYVLFYRRVPTANCNVGEPSDCHGAS